MRHEDLIDTLSLPTTATTTAVYLETLKIQPKNHRTTPRLSKQKQSKNRRKQKTNKKLTQTTRQTTNFARYIQQNQTAVSVHCCIGAIAVVMHFQRDLDTLRVRRNTLPTATWFPFDSAILTYTHIYPYTTTLRRQRPF